MSDLDHWSDDGATAAEIAAMDRLREERPHTSLHARTLGVALGAGTGLVASTAAGATGVGLIAKLLGGGVLLIGAAAIGIAIHASRGSAPQGPAPAAPSLAEYAPSADAMPSAAPSSEAEAVDPADPAPAASASASSVLAARVAPRPKASASPPSLNEEISSIERAHAANDPDATLRALDDYRARFPKGTLSAEATVLRVQALLARGESAKARALADSFAAHPESPYARRVQDLVRSAPEK